MNAWLARIAVCALGSLLVWPTTAAGDDPGVEPVDTAFLVHQSKNDGGIQTPATDGGMPPNSGGAMAIPVIGCDCGLVLGHCNITSVCDIPVFSAAFPFHTYAHSAISGAQYASAAPCDAEEHVAKGPSLPELVLRAFRRVPLPAPQLSIQPPNGKTLVGLETIYSTKAEPFTRTLALLGRQVTLRIEPSSFLWHHGDGTSQTTDWAGKAWDHDSPSIDGYLTHVYEHTGEVWPSVEVTWSAEFRVGGGAWQQVNGTVTRAGAPVPLRVLEGQPVLNSY